MMGTDELRVTAKRDFFYAGLLREQGEQLQFPRSISLRMILAGNAVGETSAEGAAADNQRAKHDFWFDGQRELRGEVVRVSPREAQELIGAGDAESEQIYLARLREPLGIDPLKSSVNEFPLEQRGP